MMAGKDKCGDPPRILRKEGENGKCDKKGKQEAWTGVEHGKSRRT